MLDWLRKLTKPDSAQEETAHREFLLKAVLVSFIGLLGVYLFVDWAIMFSLRGSLVFGNFLWLVLLPLLLFNYWLTRPGYVTLSSYLFLGLITIGTLLSMFASGSKDVSVLLFAVGAWLAGRLIGLRWAVLIVALDVLAFSALAWAETAGLRPTPVTNTRLIDVVALGLILAALVVVEWLLQSERGRLLRRRDHKHTVAPGTASQAPDKADQAFVEQEAWRRELALARKIQTSLLPRSNPTLAEFDIKGRSMPAEEVGGDFYSYLPLNDGRLGLAIGDVSGKGVASALYMAVASGIVEAQATISPDSATLVHRVNDLLYGRVHETGLNMALIYAIFDLSRRQLQVCNAGLIAPLLYRGDAFSYLECYGLPVGAVSGEVYQEQQVQLQSGDIVLLMTDGIVEAMNAHRELFGFPGLESALQNCGKSDAQGILDGVFHSVFEFMGDMPPQDDMTLVVVRLGDRSLSC